jgi:hypothetical protein
MSGLNREHDIRIGAAAAPRRILPRVAGVVLVFVLLHPDRRLREQVLTVGVVPVHVRDDVRHLMGLDAEPGDRRRGGREVLHLPSRDELLAIEAGVHEGDPAVAPPRAPTHHRDVELLLCVGDCDVVLVC